MTTTGLKSLPQKAISKSGHFDEQALADIILKYNNSSAINGPPANHQINPSKQNVVNSISIVPPQTDNHKSRN
jgi:hypothetical protein